MTRLLVRK